MRIDFHCHTRAVKSGEKETRNINAIDFKETIKNARVKIVAITNHNIFDRKQFDEFYKEVNNDFILLPGIEVDTIGVKQDKGHIVIIYDDKDLDNFDAKVEELLNGSNPDDFTITIDELIKFVNDINCIVLAHYYKPHALELESINYLKENIKDDFRFFYEPSNYRTLGIMINHSFRALKGTDILDWNDYGKQEFANIKLDIDSYKQLLKFLKKDETVIESLINKQTKYNVDVSYKKGENEIIDLYDNVNVFFGTKGTGKSVSLQKIEKHFKDNGKKTSSYSPNDNKDKLDQKLKVTDAEKKLSYYEKNNYATEFLNVSEWIESDVTQFVDYLNYVKYRGQNANKQRMKIVEIRNVLGYNAKILQKCKQDFNNLNTIIDLIEAIDSETYLGKEKNAQLNSLVSELLEKIKISYSDKFDEKLSTNYTNDAVSKIKAIVEKKTETKTIPSETGFTLFAKNRFSLEIDMTRILNGFEFRYVSEPEYIGKLEEGKLLCKKTIATMLNDSSKVEDGFTGITNLKEIKEILQSIKNNIYTTELVDFISNFKDKYDKNLSLDSFLGVIKKFSVDGKEYKPSTGEATMIVLDDALNEEHDVYILDEPEKSLGNNYVSDVLVARLNDLAKMKKVVVVATHNANVAVRTMPYRSILKVYDNGEYKTYVGNPFINKLVNIKDTNDMKDWKEESIRILEGGKEAFEERSDIYA